MVNTNGNILGPWDRLLTLREVAALKRANLQTVRSWCRKNVPMLKIGSKCAVWMSQVIDAPIPWTLTEKQSKELIQLNSYEYHRMFRRAMGARRILGGFQEPEISLVKTKMSRKRLREVRSQTGKTPPSPSGYRYSSLKELDLAALKYREAQRGVNGFTTKRGRMSLD